jgi:hypothetical protein
MATKMLDSARDFKYFGKAGARLIKAERRELHRRKLASTVRDGRRAKRQEEHW